MDVRHDDAGSDIREGRQATRVFVNFEKFKKKYANDPTQRLHS